MAFHRIKAKALAGPMMIYCQLNNQEHTSMFSAKKMLLLFRSQRTDSSWIRDAQIYESVNWAITGSDNGLLHIGQQKNWDKIGSFNGLLPDDTKPLSEPMLMYH